MKLQAVFLSLSLVALLALGGCAPRGGAGTASPIAPTAAQTSAPVESAGEGSIATPPPEDRLVVHFFDVGDADSILVQQGTQAMLIDGGTEDMGPDIARWLREVGVDALAQFVVTHSDSDHVGGVPFIMERHKPLSFLMPIVNDEDKDYQKVINTVGKAGLQITKPVPGTVFALGKAQVTVLAPNRDDYESMDDFSVVLRVVYGETSFLFTGDACGPSETDMLTHGYDLASTVLKVGHHGQNDASTTAFLSAVRPQAAVISDGVEGVAAKKVLQRLADVGADVYQTSRAGTVIATSDGKTVAFNVVPSPPEKKNKKK